MTLRRSEPIGGSGIQITILGGSGVGKTTILDKVIYGRGNAVASQAVYFVYDPIKRKVMTYQGIGGFGATITLSLTPRIFITNGGWILHVLDYPGHIQPRIEFWLRIIDEIIRVDQITEPYIIIKGQQAYHVYIKSKVFNIFKEFLDSISEHIDKTTDEDELSEGIIKITEDELNCSKELINHLMSRSGGHGINIIDFSRQVHEFIVSKKSISISKLGDYMYYSYYCTSSIAAWLLYMAFSTSQIIIIPIPIDLNLFFNAFLEKNYPYYEDPNAAETRKYKHEIAYKYIVKGIYYKDYEGNIEGLAEEIRRDLIRDIICSENRERCKKELKLKVLALAQGLSLPAHVLHIIEQKNWDKRVGIIATFTDKYWENCHDISECEAYLKNDFENIYLDECRPENLFKRGYDGVKELCIIMRRLGNQVPVILAQGVVSLRETLGRLLIENSNFKLFYFGINNNRQPITNLELKRLID